jgi:predicted naringenin-chalcone synthase
MLIDITLSNPPYKVPQEIATSELKKRMGEGRAAVSRLIDAASNHSGIEHRYIVVPDADQSLTDKFYSVNGSYISPDTKLRMTEYEKWAKILIKEAVGKLITENNVKPEEIVRLITISCTGFFAPGIDYYLMEEFNLNPTVKRTNIGFMGCAASLVGFTSVLEALSAADDEAGLTLLLSIELCSLHLQTEPSRDNILANMIFADGCAAALFSKNSLSGKMELLKTESYLFKNSSNFMGWKIGNTGFEMILSSELPKIILEQAVPALNKILERNGLKKEEIDHWALHPGGRAILDSLQKGLELSEEKMIYSRNVLKNYGNMSSASILFVLKEIIEMKKVKKGDNICCVAFGPGLTMEVALLKGV